MMDKVVTTGSVKMCNDPITLQTPANQHPAYYRPDALPVAQRQSTEGTIQGPAHPKLTWESSIIVLTTKGSWLPWVSH